MAADRGSRRGASFFEGGRRTGWYVDFQRPLRRWSGGVDTLDHGLDIVIPTDGDWRWKDREHVAEQVSTGCLTESGAAEVWREADRVATLLDSADTTWWWTPWSTWHPGADPPLLA